MIRLKCATVMIAVSRLPIIIKAKTMGQSVSQAGPFLLSNPAYSGVRSLRRRERFAKSRLSPTGSERFPMENGAADRHELQSAGSGVLYNEGIRIIGLSAYRPIDDDGRYWKREDMRNLTAFFLFLFSTSRQALSSLTVLGVRSRECHTVRSRRPLYFR